MKLNKRTNKTISKSITEVVENSVLQAKSQDQPEIKWTFVWYRGRKIKIVVTVLSNIMQARR